MRILATVLGAAGYRSVEYFIPGLGSERTNFASLALKRLLEREGRSFERVLVFGVEGAGWRLVDECLPEAERVVIPEVRTQQEVEVAFRTFSEALRDAEAPLLTLDLTHGYRHHPILLLLVGFYLSLLGHVEVDGVYYAMLPAGEQRAQFLDLSPFLALLKTATAVRSFKETLHAAGIAEIIGELRRTRAEFGRREMLEEARGLGMVEKVLGGLEELNVALSVNHTPQIVSTAARVRGQIDGSLAEVDRFYPYLLPFLQAMEAQLEQLAVPSTLPLWEHQLRHAERCLQLGRYTSAAINLREGLLSWACHRWSGCEGRPCESRGACDPRGRELRERMASTFDAVARKQLVISVEPDFEDAARLYQEVAQMRNKICHGYVGHEERVAREGIERALGELIERLRGLVREGRR